MASSSPPDDGDGLSLAILDDYAGIAPAHFRRLHEPRTLSKISSYADTLNTRTAAGLDAAVARLQPYHIISTMRERTPFPADLLARLPRLKLLLTTGMGNAAIDMGVAASRGIAVTGTKGQPTSSSTAAAEEVEQPPPAQWSHVNQHAWALLLSLCGRVAHDDHAVKTETRAWQSGLGVALGGKVLGVVGLGKLGALMARTAVLGFGMRVRAWSANLTQERADAAAEALGLARGAFQAVSKEELFRGSDVVAVHYVLSDRSRGVVGATELGWMKRSAVLVNTSRGPLVDEAALLRVLRDGGIRGAALDVFDQEPLPPDSPWRTTAGWKSEVVLSPHMGYVNEGTMNRWYQEQADIVGEWMKNGEPPAEYRIN